MAWINKSLYVKTCTTPMTFVAQLQFVIWKPFSTNLFLFGVNICLSWYY
jgi:hypothetical protein